MEFWFHAPPAELAPSIKTFWAARGSRAEFASSDPIVPDGCVEIVFNLGDPFMNGDGALQPRVLLTGQMMRPVVALPTGSVNLIGVRFRSAAAGAALRVAMWQLQDALIDAASLDPAFARCVDVLSEMPAHHRIACLGRELTLLLSPVDGDRLALVEQALAIVARRRGQVSIERVAQTIGVSRRHLERRFRDEVGLGIKDIARITRIQSVLRLLEDQSRLTGAEVAAVCGFSDQAHLIRECRALTGQTPVAISASAASLSGLVRGAF
jgi:AraC-like DNA-binding protein